MISFRGSEQCLRSLKAFDKQKEWEIWERICLSGWRFTYCACFLAGIDFKIRTIELDGKKIKLQIWYASASCWMASCELSLRFLLIQNMQVMWKTGDSSELPLILALYTSLLTHISRSKKGRMIVTGSFNAVPCKGKRSAEVMWHTAEFLSFIVI